MDLKEYSKLLERREWKDFRDRIISQRGCVCEECERKGESRRFQPSELHVHHKLYRDGHMPWKYEDDDVEVLCHYHHFRRHRILALTGRHIPVLDKQGYDIAEKFKCSRCGGSGWIKEYKLLDGECFACFGSGLSSPHLTEEDLMEFARYIWENWNSHLGDDRIKSVRQIYLWLLDIHGLSDPLKDVED